jgi:hypothetical protein
MANERNYIPRSIKSFDLYLARVCAYLILGNPTNAARFNWTAANLQAMQNFLTLWTPLHTQYTNKKGGYMPVVRTKLFGIISNVVAYAQANKLIALVIATVSLNADDCVAFGLPENLIITPTGLQPLKKTKEPDKTIVTKEPVYPKLIPIVGGFLHTKAYTEKTQSGRAHKLKGFDLLEYAVAVFYSTATGLPVTASDARQLIGHSSKASFIMEVANMSNNLTAIAANSATPTKIAVLFFRWAKSKHPDLDGPWSGPFTTPLL